MQPCAAKKESFIVTSSDGLHSSSDLLHMAVLVREIFQLQTRLRASSAPASRCIGNCKQIHGESHCSSIMFYDTLDLPFSVLRLFGPLFEWSCPFLNAVCFLSYYVLLCVWTMLLVCCSGLSPKTPVRPELARPRCHSEPNTTDCDRS